MVGRFCADPAQAECIPVHPSASVWPVVPEGECDVSGGCRGRRGSEFVRLGVVVSGCPMTHDRLLAHPGASKVHLRSPVMPLPEAKIKENLSYAYIHAIASREGFAIARTVDDFDSVDVTIDAIGPLEPGGVWSPQIAIQLKATSQKRRKMKMGTEEVFPFQLPMKNYEDLRKKRMVPAILVVFFMPQQARQWLSHKEAGLTTRRCAYWVNLCNQPPSANASVKTVYLPTNNVFNGATLRQLLLQSSKRALP